ncbi:MAG: hypothetical protein OSJ55_08825, partial [Bacteroidales bacterium]|nr:hypothetical protein [Bacteroidales bacterium]
KVLLFSVSPNLFETFFNPPGRKNTGRTRNELEDRRLRKQKFLHKKTAGGATEGGGRETAQRLTSHIEAYGERRREEKAAQRKERKEDGAGKKRRGRGKGPRTGSAGSRGNKGEKRWREKGRGQRGQGRKRRRAQGG